MLGLDPASVAYVGDEKDIDAGAAAEAGLAVGIWLDRPGSPPQAGELGANVVRVESLSEVAQVLALDLLESILRGQLQPFWRAACLTL